MPRQAAEISLSLSLFCKTCVSKVSDHWLAVWDKTSHLPSLSLSCLLCEVCFWSLKWLGLQKKYFFFLALSYPSDPELTDWQSAVLNISRCQCFLMVLPQTSMFLFPTTQAFMEAFTNHLWTILVIYFSMHIETRWTQQLNLFCPCTWIIA